MLLLSGLASATSERPPAQSVVAKLYQDYAWEVIFAEPGQVGVGLLQAPVATLGQYFTPALAASIAADQACVERTQEICQLSFSPIWAGQDPGAIGMSIEAGREPSTVQVRFTHPATQEAVELGYTLEWTANGWRIANITAADWNLRELLDTSK
jgi:hypothetical protein